MLRLFFFSCFALEAAGRISPNLERAPPGVISRLPGQIGDSADHIVSSVGHEVGSGLDTVAQGVGEVPRAIGKAVGSVPDAVGHGIGNVGDVSLEELKNLAGAIGDTWRGAGQSILDILRSLRGIAGAPRRKRAADQLVDLKGLDFGQQLSLLRTSLQKISSGTGQELCKMVYLLESATSPEQVAAIAPGTPLVASLHDILGRVNEVVCSGIDVKPEVDQLVAQVKTA